VAEAASRKSVGPDDVGCCKPAAKSAVCDCLVIYYLNIISIIVQGLGENDGKECPNADLEFRRNCGLLLADQLVDIRTSARLLRDDQSDVMLPEGEGPLRSVHSTRPELT